MKMIGWTLVTTIMLMPVFIVWHELSRGRPLKLLLLFAIGAFVFWKYYRAAQRVRRGQSLAD